MNFSIEHHELRKVAELIAVDHPSLATLWLEPDGKFQTKAMRHDSLAQNVASQLHDGFRKINKNDFPHLYYGCGRARGGSTSLTNVFGIAGIPSYYQPVKSVLRHVLSDVNSARWDLNPEHKYLFAKETFGPYTLAECIFLPIEALIDAGYPVDRIHLIIFDREPTSALASWLAHWANRVPEEILVLHFLMATFNAHRVAKRAKRIGIKVTTYVYELSKEPLISIRSLFGDLGISHLFSDAAVMDWKNRGDLDSAKSGIIFPEEPQIFDVPGLHGSDVAYRFHARPPKELPESYESFLRGSGVFELYRNSVQACIASLGIDRSTAERTFDRSFV